MTWVETTFDRVRLYEEVWSTPLLHLARRYGVSGVGLAKICRRLRVPLPGRGHWVRVAAGRTPKRAALPALKPGQEVTHVLRRWRDPCDDVETSEEAVDLIDREKTPEMRVEVDGTLDKPHPLIQRYAGRLRRSQRKQEQLLLEGRCLDIIATGEALERALRLANAILFALDRRGFKVEVTEPSAAREQSYYGSREPTPSKTGVHILGHFVTFRVEELHDIVKVEPRPAKAPRRGATTWVNTPPVSYKHVPNEKLSLKITTRSAPRARSIWRDGGSQRIEARINTFIVALIETAERKRVEAIVEERRERARVLALQRQEEERRRREIEEALAFDLNSRITDWARAQEVRRFTDAVEAAARSRGEALDPGSDLGRWIAWARDRANCLDRAAIEKVAKEQRRPR